MRKKITYELKVDYKYSMLDMSFDFRISGYILYRNKKFCIDVLKAHEGPQFHYRYFEKTNEAMEDILYKISNDLIMIVDFDLSKNGPVQDRIYKGEIEIE